MAKITLKWAIEVLKAAGYIVVPKASRHARDFPGGDYHNECVHCQRTFTGKRRYICCAQCDKERPILHPDTLVQQQERTERIYQAARALNPMWEYMSAKDAAALFIRISSLQIEDEEKRDLKMKLLEYERQLSQTA